VIFPFGLRYAYLKPVYATGALLIICSGVYFLEWVGVVDPDRWGLMRSPSQPERLVTHHLLHGPPWHLVMNMLALIVFGQLVNAAVGSWLFLLVAAVVAAGSSALQLALDDRLVHEPSIGISGILAGLVAIGCLWLPRVKIRFIFWFLFMFGFVEFTAWSVGATWLVSDLFTTLFTDWKADRTAYWGHLGGFAGGLLCYAVMKVYRVAELTGFLVEPLNEKSRRRWIRKLRLLKTSAPDVPEEVYRVRFCLRCGDEQFLTDYVEGKPMKCLKCGQASAMVRARDDAELKRRRRQCALVLAAPMVALFALSWFLMDPPERAINESGSARPSVSVQSLR